MFFVFVGGVREFVWIMKSDVFFVVGGAVMFVVFGGVFVGEYLFVDKMFWVFVFCWICGCVVFVGNIVVVLSVGDMLLIMFVFDVDVVFVFCCNVIVMCCGKLWCDCYCCCDLMML